MISNAPPIMTTLSLDLPFGLRRISGSDNCSIPAATAACTSADTSSLDRPVRTAIDSRVACPSFRPEEYTALSTSISSKTYHSSSSLPVNVRESMRPSA